MHIAFVADYVPTPLTSGAGVHLWSLLTRAIEDGHSVTVVVVGRPHEFQILDAAAVDRMVRGIQDAGATLVRADPTGSGGASRSPRALRLAARLRRAAAPRGSDYDRDFDVEAIREALLPELARIAPDVVFVFNDGPIAACRGWDRSRRVAWPSDPIHLLYASRWKHGAAQGKDRAALLLQRWSYRSYPRWITEQLASYDTVIHQAAHHARWFREQGVENCLYIPSPIADPLAGASPAAISRDGPSRRLKILHLGHLGGAASMTGLPVFLDETMPALEKELGIDGFEMHFVGRVDLRGALRERLVHPSIQLRGFVDDLTAEIGSADTFLVPIPHEVGSRTRLLTALAYGSCVVAHDSCRLGNPELRHDENVLLAGTGAGLAQQILRAWRDPELRQRMRSNGRATYEQHFSLDTAGRRWIAAITGSGDEAARRRAEAAQSEDLRAGHG